MRHISALPHHYDTSAALAELVPDMWDQHRMRTESPISPHREVSDIWVRYNHLDNLGPHFNDQHESVWYEVADRLPACVQLVDDLAGKLGAAELGGVLITKIPSGKQVYPHADSGWHALYYEKFAILLQGNEEQSFCYDDGEFHCAPGDCWTFNNQATHWVKNPTPMDRVSLIVCAKRGVI